MASNKRRGDLDQSTRNHLSALDAFIKEQAEAHQPRQPGEFTIQDYIEKMKESGIKISLSTAVRTMDELLESGKVVMRKAYADGRFRKLYRFL